MSDMLIKMMIALAMLVIILIIFPGNMYGQAKEWLDQQFNFKDTGKITKYSAETYMKHTTDDISACIGKTGSSCLCPYRFELTNDDYSMGFEYTGAMKDNMPLVKASIKDKEGKTVGKEMIVIGGGCLLTASVSLSMSIERIWTPEVKEGIILKYTVKRDNFDMHQSESWSDPYNALVAISGGKEYIVEDSLFKTKEGNACFYTEEYSKYLRQESSVTTTC
jgi:hypothetical protein